MNQHTKKFAGRWLLVVVPVFNGVISNETFKKRQLEKWPLALSENGDPKF